MPKFSIIVPIYNVEAYLPQCLDSIREQNHSDFEVICVIDGSTDRSEVIARMFAQVDSRISVITKENGGLSSARNAGIAVAKGEYLVFVDSDDLLNRNALKTLDQALAGSTVEIVTFGAEAYPHFYNDPWLDAVLSPRDATYESFEPTILFEENSHPYVWRTIVSKSFFDRTGLLFDETLPFGEDQLFHFQCYPRANGVKLISDKLYRYRVLRPNSLMAGRNDDIERKLRDHALIVRRILDDWKHQGYLETYRAQILEFVIEFLADDYAQHATAENNLLDVLHDVLCDYFDTGDMSLLQSVSAQEISRYVMSNEHDAASQAFAELRGRYLADRNIPYGAAEDTRPEWQRRLRQVFPMTAIGLEERLQNMIKIDDLSTIQWFAEDAAACTRSLELLRIEIMANQFKNERQL